MASSICATCGNPVPLDEPICPFCEGIERVGTQRERFRRLDLGHRGLSTASAVRKLKEHVERATKDGVQVLKVITGYGSTGSGGSIRRALLAECHRMRATGRIEGFLEGEHLRSGSPHAEGFIRRYPEVRDLPDWNAGNEGLILIGL